MCTFANKLYFFKLIKKTTKRKQEKPLEESHKKKQRFVAAVLTTKTGRIERFAAANGTFKN